MHSILFYIFQREIMKVLMTDLQFKATQLKKISDAQNLLV